MNSEELWLQDVEDDEPPSPYSEAQRLPTKERKERPDNGVIPSDDEQELVPDPVERAPVVKRGVLRRIKGADPPDIENQKLDCPSPAKQNSVSNTVSLNYKPTKAPKDTLQAVYKTGEYKAGLPLNLLMIQSFMAGIYIAMAGHLYLAVGGGLLGGALFPTGLIAVILTSAELFTGDALVFVASVLGRRVSFYKLLRNWTVSWIMNFAGGLFWAYAIAYASGSIEDLGRTEFAIAVAMKKVKPSWHKIFLKGIGANFMVCVGVWQATCAEEVAGKVLALWFPISAFVMLGFDHCIANQFLIPLGMMLGADISISDLLFHALAPATLGNIVGGGVLVGGVYWYVYDSMASSKRLFSDIQGMLQRRPPRNNENAGTRTPPENETFDS